MQNFFLFHSTLRTREGQRQLRDALNTGCWNAAAYSFNRVPPCEGSPQTRTEQMSMYPRVTVQYYAASGVCMIIFGALRALKTTPGTTTFITKLVRRALATDLSKEIYWDSLFSWKMYKSVTASIWIDLMKTACHGGTAPNPRVFSADGQNQRHLLDFAHRSRPLVVNFGSVTCPVFMAKLAEFERMKIQFSDVADFLVVYIEEAHPSDGWALKKNTDVKQHGNLEDRRDAARKLQHHSPCSLSVPIVLDSDQNEANRAFGALPLRLYVLHGGRVMYEGGMGPVFYRMPEVEEWLSGWKALKVLTP